MNTFFRCASERRHLFLVWPQHHRGAGSSRFLRLKEWFEERKDRFERLGLFWGDPRLAIGWLPVADLDCELLDFSEK